VPEEDHPVLHLAEHHLVAAVRGVDPHELLEQEPEPPLRERVRRQAVRDADERREPEGEGEDRARYRRSPLRGVRRHPAVLARERGDGRTEGRRRVGLPRARRRAIDPLPPDQGHEVRRRRAASRDRPSARLTVWPDRSGTSSSRSKTSTPTALPGGAW